MSRYRVGDRAIYRYQPHGYAKTAPVPLDVEVVALGRNRVRIRRPDGAVVWVQPWKLERADPAILSTQEAT